MVKITVGDRYNQLTFVKFVKNAGERPKRVRYGEFLCTCGQTKVTSVARVVAGRTLSCGCVQRQRSSKSVSGRNAKQCAPGQAAKNFVYRRYKAGAHTRGIAFELGLDAFLCIAQKPCYYCGSMPGRKANKGTVKGFSQNFIYSGIDRVDSARGYVADNVVPCCSRCNYMKRTMSVAEFLDAIRLIANHLLRTSASETPHAPICQPAR